MKIKIALLTFPLFLGLGLAAPTVTPSADPGSTPGDLFQNTNINISANTALYSNQFNIQDMFGTSLGTLEPGHVIFTDGLGANATYTVTFNTLAPVVLGGYNLFLQDDSTVGTTAPGNPGQRSAVSFTLTANGNLVSTASLLAPGGSYSSTYGSSSIKVSDTFAPVSASNFVATFTGNNIGPAFGVRVLELDGLAGTLPGVPEPGTISMLVLGLAGLAVSRIRKSA